MIRRAAIGIIGVLALISACSDNKTVGTPSAAPSSSNDSATAGASSTPSQALPFAGAPKVANPLPASVLSGDPCQNALTPDQVVQALGAQVAGEPHSVGGIGPSCGWFNRNTTGKVVVTYVTEIHTGLSAVYQNTKPGNNTWLESTVQGFPAVAHDKGSTSCQISVGLADDASVDVTLFLGSSKLGSADPCQVVPQVAALVVDTLKKKAGA